MNHLLRLIVVGGLVAFGVLIMAVGLARNDVDLLAPLDLFLFLIALAIYFLPTGLAVYRNCRATPWIVAVNVLLGWTLFGWFVAIGWAASGKVQPLPATALTSPGHPLPRH